MSLKSLVVAAAALLPVAAQAGERPTEGTETYNNIWVVTSSSVVKSGDGFVSTQALSGVTTNDEGGLFNNNTGTCLLVYGKFNGVEYLRGSCVKADKDGDQFFEEVGAHDGKIGTSTLAGGVGKFAGVTGEETFTSTPMKSPDGHDMYLTTTKVHYKLP